MISLGYTIFTVENVEETLAFFSDAFDIPQRMLTPEGDYGELETGPTVLAFVSHELARANLDDAGGFTPLDATKPPTAGSITLVTEDLAAVAARAIESGATSYVAPVEKPWGQTVTYLRDPNGILVELATPIANPTGGE